MIRFTAAEKFYLPVEILRMSEENRPHFTGTAIAAAAGIGLCFVVAKYRTQILKQLKCIINYNDPLRNQRIQVISGVEECRLLMRNLKTYVKFDRILFDVHLLRKYLPTFRHCDEFSVLGFDCEWVTVGGARRPVALLQLTSHRGLCALIRLSHLQMIPSELKVGILLNRMIQIPSFLIKKMFFIFYRKFSKMTIS